MNVHHAAEYYAGEIAQTLGVFADKAGRERAKALVEKAIKQGADQALDGPWSTILHTAMPDDVRAQLFASVIQASAQFGNARLKRDLRPCLCPNGHGQMTYHDGVGTPGGEYWDCETCHIQRMWPDTPGQAVVS